MMMMHDRTGMGKISKGSHEKESGSLGMSFNRQTKHNTFHLSCPRYFTNHQIYSRGAQIPPPNCGPLLLLRVFPTPLRHLRRPVGANLEGVYSCVSTSTGGGREGGLELPNHIPVLCQL